MEQEGRDGGRGEMNRQLQAYHEPHQCPRCDSFNTKFCYFNNYSMNQPRYFCKSCRRYWTKGGTLRNVPVGGGSRKGKRAKSSTSASNSSGNSSVSKPMLSQPTVQSTVAAMAKDSALNLPSFSSAAPFYQGGGGVGYMSSFAGFNHSLNPNPSFTFDHPSLNLGGVGSSNLSLLQGFNMGAALGNSSQGQNRPSLQQYYQMGGNGGTLFTSQQQGLNLIPQSTMSNASAAAWPHNFIANGTINTTSIPGGNSDRNGSGVGGSGNGGVGAAGSATLTPNQWPDLSGFNAPQ